MNNKKPIAIVTGAAKGIGKAICKKLVNDGFYVVAVDLDVAGAGLTNELGIDCVEFQNKSICIEQQVKELFAEVKNKLGTISAVINNAGIIRDNMIWNMSVDDFDTVVNVNLKGTWLMCREAAIIMKEQKF